MATRKSTPARTARPAAPAPDASAEPAEGADGQPAEDATPVEEDVPMNRAERRAKGRGKTAAAPDTGRGKVVGGHGPAHTRRNWANRRSG